MQDKLQNDDKVVFTFTDINSYLPKQNNKDLTVNETKNFLNTTTNLSDVIQIKLEPNFDTQNDELGIINQVDFIITEIYCNNSNWAITGNLFFTSDKYSNKTVGCFIKIGLLLATNKFQSAFTFNQSPVITNPSFSSVGRMAGYILSDDTIDSTYNGLMSGEDKAYLDYMVKPKADIIITLGQVTTSTSDISIYNVIIDNEIIDKDKYFSTIIKKFVSRQYFKNGVYGIPNIVFISSFNSTSNDATYFTGQQIFNVLSCSMSTDITKINFICLINGSLFSNSFIINIQLSNDNTFNITKYKQLFDD